MSSIIHEDIRKRSIRIQRDQILNQLRQDEDLAMTSIPRRIIMEVEDRAREAVDSNSWKRYFIMFIIAASVVYGLYRLINILNARMSEFSLQNIFPKTHAGFVRNGGPDWLVSEITGSMTFDYFNEKTGEAIDFITSDDNRFPSPKYKNEIDFQNAIYNRAMKKELCEKHEVSYVVVIDNNSISYESRYVIDSLQQI